MLSEDGVSGFTTRRVAERAQTSVPAVYELFTDKAGLVRAVYFEGFRRLGRALAAVPETTAPLVDLERLIPVFRRFCLDYPAAGAGDVLPAVPGLRSRSRRNSRRRPCGSC